MDTPAAKEAFIKAKLKEEIPAFLHDYTESRRMAYLWKEPLVGYADVNGASIRALRETISPTHYLPQDILPGCTVILSYFLPFQNAIGMNNTAGSEPSAQWIAAYKDTNRAFVELNLHLTAVIEQLGFRAATPDHIGTISAQRVFSNWSQRHIAYAAGLGTFGINNMLITDSGCCGRLYSLVTDLPVTPDVPRTEEACLYKRSGKCAVCIRRCPIQALSVQAPFDRRRCYDHLGDFSDRLGASACGKCTLGLPCTYQNPAK